MKRNIQIGIVALIVIVLAAGASYYFTQPAQMPQAPKPELPKKLTQVTLVFDWLIKAPHAPYYIAQEKGYYRDEGIEVKFVEGQGGPYALGLVASEKAEFALATGNAILAARVKGVPVKVVAQIMQNYPAGYFAFPESGIKSPKDLEGKRLAAKPPTQADYVIHRMLMERLGVDYSKVTEVPMQFDMVSPLLLGKADASMGWITDILSFVPKGRPDVVFIPYIKFGMNPVSIAIVTNEKLIKENPQLVRGFVKASLLGWKYSFDHPGEAIDLLMKYKSGLNRIVELDGLLIYLKDLVWSQTVQTRGLGYFDLNSWDDTQEAIYKFKVIESKVPIADVVTTDFLPKEPIIPSKP